MLNLLIWWYRGHQTSYQCKLHYKENKFNNKVLSLCPILLGGYHPATIWGRNGHLQTFYHFFIRRSPKVQFDRTLLVTATGHVNYDVPSSIPFDLECPTVVIIPGITGSSKNHYIRNYVDCCTKKGWRTVVLNHRGCNSELSHPSSFTVEGPTDLRKVLEHVHKTYPTSPLIATGFSLGANILINYLGKYHNKETSSSEYIPLLGAIAFCVSYNLVKTMEYLPLQRPLYDFGLNFKMVSFFKRHQQVFEKVCNLDVPSVLKAKSLKDFDRHFTCKIYKYDTPETYYSHHCCSNFLHKIDIPTLIVNALDDPINPEAIISRAYEICGNSDKVMMATTLYGGHLGFAEGTVIPKQSTWMDRIGIEYLSAIIKLTEEPKKIA